MLRKQSDTKNLNPNNPEKLIASWIEKICPGFVREEIFEIKTKTPADEISKKQDDIFEPPEWFNAYKDLNENVWTQNLKDWKKKQPLFYVWIKDSFHHKSRDAAFIDFVFFCVRMDKKLSVVFSKVNDPRNEYRCWPYLKNFNISFESPQYRIPYVMVISSISRSGAKGNGDLSLGKALACLNQSDAQFWFKRLLDCDSTKDFFMILKPLLKLIFKNKQIKLDFERLLSETIRFDKEKLEIRVKWTKDFYGV